MSDYSFDERLKFGAREITKTINESPDIAKDIVKQKTTTPEKSVKELIRESKANKNRMAYVGSKPNGPKDANAWYTPKIYVDAVKEVLGNIEIDPYSDEIANNTVNAERFFTIDDPAETHEWICKTLFMNPPYSPNIMKRAVCKFIEELQKHNFNAIVLTNNSTETRWFKQLVSKSSYFCFTDHRISFETYDGKNESNNTRGQIFFYFGKDIERFKKVFNKFGWCGSYGGI